MLTKEKVLNAINQLPGEFSIEDVIDELLLLERIEKGLDQSEKDDVTADEDLDRELPEWLN
jgi:hypothetical protein